MIEVKEDCEYITMIADLIELLANCKESYKLKIWVNGCENPFEYESKDVDIIFLQEGMRIHRTIEYHYLGVHQSYSYIFYDNIVNVLVVINDES